MFKWIKDTITEPDNKTICPVRIMGIIGAIQGLVMQGYAVFILHSAADLQQYGIGLGAVIVALGVALGYKKDTPINKEGDK